MNKRVSTVLSCGIAVALMAAPPFSNASNILVNGNFASTDNGFSETLTPVGWTNIGHIDGVISDSVFGTPAYGGSTYYYDTGGYGGATPASGDGIEQTVGTSIGTTYDLSLGVSSENVGGGPEFLNVLVNGTSIAQFQMILNSAYGAFDAPWTTENLSFVAGSTSTTIAFTVTGTDLGALDPLIAGVDLEAATATATTPEPSSFVFLGTGILGLAGAIRRKVRA
jgi:PEP-CTERM motif